MSVNPVDNLNYFNLNSKVHTLKTNMQLFPSWANNSMKPSTPSTHTYIASNINNR